MKNVPPSRSSQVWADRPGFPRKRPGVSQQGRSNAGPDQELGTILFIHFALATAGRMSAILELTWDRVDLVSRRINLRDPNRSVTRKGRAVVHSASSANAGSLLAPIFRLSASYSARLWSALFVVAVLH